MFDFCFVFIIDPYRFLLWWFVIFVSVPLWTFIVCCNAILSLTLKSLLSKLCQNLVDFLFLKCSLELSLVIGSTGHSGTLFSGRLRYKNRKPQCKNKYILKLRNSLLHILWWLKVIGQMLLWPVFTYILLYYFQWLITAYGIWVFWWDSFSHPEEKLTAALNFTRRMLVAILNFIRKTQDHRDGNEGWENRFFSGVACNLTKCNMDVSQPISRVLGKIKGLLVKITMVWSPLRSIWLPYKIPC